MKTQRSFSLLLCLATALTASAAPPPQEIKFDGDLNLITRLADGRLFSAVGTNRPPGQPGSDIRHQVFGRFSADHGLHWTAPQLLFEPKSVGHLQQPISLGANNGDIHIFYFQVVNAGQAFDSMSGILSHSVSHDGGKTWQEPHNIDHGARYIGALLSVAQLKSGRILLPFCYKVEGRSLGHFASTAVYSDDGGATWRRSNNSVLLDSGGRVLESGTIEPGIAQLKDGRLWMVMRTQTGYVFESYSVDGGQTWSEGKRTAFRDSNSPMAALQLSSGPLVVSWNNEFGENLFHGVSYCRQAITMAINDGNGWKGFRQITPPFGSTADYFGTSNYSFLTESGDGTILIGYRGRRMTGEKSRTHLFRVDPQWLRETKSEENFSEGTSHLYMVGTAGGEVVNGADNMPALHLKKVGGEKPSGFTWNFPFGRKGTVRMRMRIDPGFGGAFFTLAGYSVRPSNTESGVFRWAVGPDLKWKLQYTNDGPYREEIGPHPRLTQGEIQTLAPEDRTFELTVEWNCDNNVANIFQDGHFVAFLVGLEPTEGIAYLRIVAPASGPEGKGLWVMNLQSCGAGC